jgi:hypothetical protein
MVAIGDASALEKIRVISDWKSLLQPITFFLFQALAEKLRA